MGSQLRRALPTLAALALLAAPARRVAAQDLQLPSFDYGRWAHFVVRQLLDTQPYERYVLIADPSYHPDFIDALRAEFLEARAIDAGTILFDGRLMTERRAQVRPRATDSIFRTRSNQAMRRLLEDADIYLWLPYRHGDGSEPGDRRLLEHLVEGTGARGLHFHWIWPLERLGTGPEAQALVDSLSGLYQLALDIDYAALSARQDSLTAVLKGSTVRITTNEGTDLTFHIPPDAWFHKNDGRLDRARAAQATSVRDLEMELPAGALRFIPDVTSVNGVLVAPGRPGEPGIRFVFRGGRITSAEARGEEPRNLAAWRRATGDKDRLAEIVIGTNPRLPREGPGGTPPYFGYGAGVLRIAIGENWESGGSNRSSLEASWYFTDATVRAGDLLVIQDGRLIVPDRLLPGR
jgi:leucyl aminopeptidase (aminopeptidase T)